MKYLIAMTCAAFAGFVGAWMLFQPAAGILPASTSPAHVTTANFAPLPATQEGASPTDQAPPQLEDIDRAGSVFSQLYMAWQLAAASDVPRLEALIEEALQRADPLWRESIASIFLERYVSIDARGAADFVQDNFAMDQTAMMSHVLTSWVRYDPEAAIDYYRSLTDRSIRIVAGSRLLADPTLAASGLRQEIIDVLGDRQAEQILRQLEMRRADPAELYETASLLEGDERRTRMQYAVSQWVRVDPETALGRISALSNAVEREQLLRIAISSYGQSDPEAALAYVQRNFPNEERLLAQAISGLASRDLQRALPLAEDFERRFGNDHALTQVVRNWASRDPAAAIRYTATLRPEQQRRMLPMVAPSYLRDDPEAALRWLIGLDGSFDDIKRSALRVQGAEVAAAAERLLPGTTDPVSRRALLAGIAGYKARSEPLAALQWLESYEDDPGWNDATRMVLHHLAQVDPYSAADFIESDFGRLGDLATTVAGAWYERSPDGAADWLDSLPAGATRDGAIGQLATRSASRRDTDATIELLQLMPAGPARDSAGERVAILLARSDMDAAREVIRRLSLPARVTERIAALSGE